MCNEHYYSEMSTGSCEDFCAGDLSYNDRTGVVNCLLHQNFYVAFQTSYAIADMTEVDNMVKLTVELINNKTGKSFYFLCSHYLLEIFVPCVSFRFNDIFLKLFVKMAF